MKRRSFGQSVLATLGLLPVAKVAAHPQPMPDHGYRFVLIDKDGKTDFPRPYWYPDKQDLKWVFDDCDYGRTIVNYTVRGPGGMMMHPHDRFSSFTVYDRGDTININVSGLYTGAGSKISIVDIAEATAADTTFREPPKKFTLFGRPVYGEQGNPVDVWSLPEP